jgi:polysaccharide pyruvyl transferase WcaK-like protein
MPVRVGLWGNFGSLNLGNECTLAAALSNLRARRPQLEISAICRDPDDTRRRHGIAAILVNRRYTKASTIKRFPLFLQIVCVAALEMIEWVRVFGLVGRFDVLMITGCGILSGLNETAIGAPYELLKWSCLARLRRVRLCYVSVGAETLSRPLACLQIRWALKLAHYRSYRDENSAALLAACGVDSKHDRIRPDLAFGLTVPAVELRVGGPVCVAIGLLDYRALAGDGASEHYDIYLDRLCALIAALSSRGCLIRIIVGDFRFDEQVRLDLRKELERRGVLPGDGRYVDEPADSFELLLQQLARVDFVIASRFHNVLLSLLLGKPAISLSYESKNDSLMASMGLASFCQPVAAFDVDTLLKQFGELQCAAPDPRMAIAAQVERNRISAAEQFDDLATLTDR